MDIQLEEIHFIFLTHFHPDHISDLIHFLFFLANSRRQPKTSLEIWGPAGLATLLAGFQKIYGNWLDKLPIISSELSGSLLQFPAFSVRWAKVLHNSESVGYRFEIDRKIIVFSGDSDYCPELVELSRQADLAVLECSYPDDTEVAGHLTPAKVGKIGREAAIKHIVLTHLYPEIKAGDLEMSIKKIYSGKVSTGKDSAQFIL
jgi:ribonuclease BN (tRNA processing enzyme)